MTTITPSALGLKGGRPMPNSARQTEEAIRYKKPKNTGEFMLSVRVPRDLIASVMKRVEEDSPLGSNDVRLAPTNPFPQPLPFTPFAAPRLNRFPLPSTHRNAAKLVSCKVSRKRTPQDNCWLAQNFHQAPLVNLIVRTRRLTDLSI